MFGDIMTIYDKIRILREKNDMSQQELAEKVGFKTASAVNKIELGLRDINQSKILAFAKALHTTPSYLLGDDDFEPPEISTDNIEFPVIGDIAAGFDKIAIEEWTEDKISIPKEYLKEHSQDEFFVLRVTGDSMYPDYRNGDKLLIFKQQAVDYSGQVAAVIYGNEYGTLKKVEYRKDSIHLVPINPQYTSEIINGADMGCVHILGVPKLLLSLIHI